MAQYTEKAQYPRIRIEQFVASKKDALDPHPLAAPQLQRSEAFASIKDKLSGPLDLLYHFSRPEREPALGFQQVDGESDEDEQYTLSYIAPELENDWKQYDSSRSM